MPEINLRVKTVEVGQAEQRVRVGGAFSSGVGTCEDIVLATESDDAQGAFGSVVVDFELAMVEVGR